MVDAADNEIKLVECARTGDFEAFATLYSCHLDAIFRYIFYRTNDRQDAEDLTEKVFLRAWEGLSKYQPAQGNFLHWLYRIAHNLVVDHHRRRNLIRFEALGSEGVARESDPAQLSALETIIRVEESTSLAAAITKLPEEYQQVIILRFIEGMGHTEIAHILDKSEGACRGIQHRALNSLSRLLSGQ